MEYYSPIPSPSFHYVIALPIPPTSLFLTLFSPVFSVKQSTIDYNALSFYSSILSSVLLACLFTLFSTLCSLIPSFLCYSFDVVPPL